MSKSLIDECIEHLGRAQKLTEELQEMVGPKLFASHMRPEFWLGLAIFYGAMLALLVAGLVFVLTTNR